MYITSPITMTEQMLSNDGESDKFKGLLNANFQDYLDAVRVSGELQVKSGKLQQQISGVFSSLGLAAGAFAGPAGLAAGFAVGNTVGKYVGNVMSNRIYGRALSDISEIYVDAKARHTQLATAMAFNDKMGEAVDTLRSNENKRLKDALQAMNV